MSRLAIHVVLLFNCFDRRRQESLTTPPTSYLTHLRDPFGYSIELLQTTFLANSSERAKLWSISDSRLYRNLMCHSDRRSSGAPGRLSWTDDRRPSYGDRSGSSPRQGPRQQASSRPSNERRTLADVVQQQKGSSRQTSPVNTSSPSSTPPPGGSSPKSSPTTSVGAQDKGRGLAHFLEEQGSPPKSSPTGRSPAGSPRLTKSQGRIFVAPDHPKAGPPDGRPPEGGERDQRTPRRSSGSQDSTFQDSLLAAQPFLVGQITTRVADPKTALHFYQNVLGMKLLSIQTVEPYAFTLYFLAYTADSPPDEEDLRSVKNREWCWQRRYTTLGKI